MNLNARLVFVGFLLLVSLLHGCAYNQFPDAWRSVYVKDHDFHNAALCDVIDALRKDSLPALDKAGLNGYSVILDMDTSHVQSISENDVFSDDMPFHDRHVSLHIPSLPLADAYKFLGKELGFDVYYENGIIFLKEKKRLSR